MSAVAEGAQGQGAKSALGHSRLVLRDFVLLWLCGLYLRLTLLVAPPLAPEIARELDLTVTAMGALTTLPVLMLALAAIAGAWVIARLGAQRTVALCLALIAVMSAARAGATVPWALFVATAVMGLGIAALQPALPTLVRLWAPGQIALATAVYMNGMLMGEVLSAGFTLPVIMPLVGDDWRLAMVAWSLPGLLIGLWAWRHRPLGYRAPQALAQDAERPLWIPNFRDPTIWYLGAVLGTSASLFFGINAYMGSILEQRGEGEQLAAGLFLFNTAQVAASIAAFRYAGRWLGRARPMLGLLLTCLVGTLMFATLPGWIGLWAAFMVSLMAGIVLILMVSMPAAIAAQADTARLAAGMFTVGYALSFLVPLLSGVLVDLTGTALWALGPLLLLNLVSLPAALLLARRYRTLTGEPGVSTGGS